MSLLDAQGKRRLRGMVLKLIYENHYGQKHRLDGITLHGVLERLHFDVSRNQVRTVLQDLKDRNLLRFTQEKDPDTGKISIRQIQVRPAGIDLQERTTTDPAVEVE